MNNHRPLIGLIGYAGSGKSTLAKALHEHHGYEMRAFADPVRQALRALDPIVAYGSYGSAVHLSELLAHHDWDYVKNHFPQVRILLQRLGTDAIRTLDPMFWVALGMDGVSNRSQAIVWHDVRFLNECRAIRNYGGVIVRVVRPDVTPANEHRSETELDGFEADYVSPNDGFWTPQEQVDALLDMYRHERGWTQLSMEDATT